MKKIKFLFLTILFAFSVSIYTEDAKAEIDPRLKALGVMAVYGTAGGLLLGTASLAFDTPGRSPFVGASLGLYAGLIFGSYVVITHAVKKHRLENPGGGDDNYYPETPDSPYEGPFGGGDQGLDDGQGYEQKWKIYWDSEKSGDSIKRSLYYQTSQKKFKAPPIFINLINLRF